MKFYGEIDLLALNNVEVINHDGEDGKARKGVFVPFNDNLIAYYPKYRKCRLKLNILERRPNPHNISHNIKPYIKKTEIKSYMMKFGKPRYIGNLFPVFGGKDHYNLKDYKKIDEILG